MARELISKRTRTEFREFLVGWTLREISDEFEGEYIECRTDYDPGLSGQRRSLVEQYYASLDFRSWADVQKLLRVYENILNTVSSRLPENVQRLNNFLQRDGYEYRDGAIHVIQAGLPTLTQAKGIAVTYDAQHMITQIARIEASIETDPDLAIGSAKELVETCCKTILSDRKQPFPPNADLPKLTKLVMAELKLLPEDIPDTARGSDTIRRLLSNLSSVAQGLAEIRNLYGTGHGKYGRTSSVKPRHAKLVVGAATTLAVFLYETHIESWNPGTRPEST